MRSKRFLPRKHPFEYGAVTRVSFSQLYGFHPSKNIGEVLE